MTQLLDPIPQSLHRDWPLILTLHAHVPRESSSPSHLYFRFHSFYIVSRFEQTSWFSWYKDTGITKNSIEEEEVGEESDETEDKDDKVKERDKLKIHGNDETDNEIIFNVIFV